MGYIRRRRNLLPFRPICSSPHSSNFSIETSNAVRADTKENKRRGRSVEMVVALVALGHVVGERRWYLGGEVREVGVLLNTG